MAPTVLKDLAEVETTTPHNAKMDTNTDLFATDTNLVLQVNRSHLDRMEEFLRTHYDVDVTSGVSGDGDATQKNTCC